MSRLKKHLSVANVLSVTALFIALGGSAYAAVKLRPNQVRSVNIAKEAVTQQKLKASAVTSGKIANGQVNNRDLASGSVSAGKIGGEAVTAKKLGKKSVTATTLGPEAVTNAKLGKESVSIAKMAGSLYGQLIKNVTYITETSKFDSLSPKTATAFCPVGKEVLGGGVRINGDTRKSFRLNPLRMPASISVGPRLLARKHRERVPNGPSPPSPSAPNCRRGNSDSRFRRARFWRALQVSGDAERRA